METPANAYDEELKMWERGGSVHKTKRNRKRVRRRASRRT
jgi:hypothetical protein